MKLSPTSPKLAPVPTKISLALKIDNFVFLENFDDTACHWNVHIIYIYSYDGHWLNWYWKWWANWVIYWGVNEIAGNCFIGGKCFDWWQ